MLCLFIGYIGLLIDINEPTIGYTSSCTGVSGRLWKLPQAPVKSDFVASMDKLLGIFLNTVPLKAPLALII